MATPKAPKARVHKDPNGHPSATELGDLKAHLRALGFSAQQAAQLNMGRTRRENANVIAGWNRAQGNAK